MSVIEALAEACGPEHVWEAGPADTVDGVPAGWVAAPGTADEVAGVLRVAAAAGLSVVPFGAGTKLDWGLPPAHVDVLLDLGRLTGVLDLSPDEQTVTVGAGTPIRALRAYLMREGRRVPLDVASPGATVGGVIAANEAGPLRHRFGTPRELVTGVRVALDEGSLVGSLADGQDLARQICGSYGTLGVITEATLRLEPLPAARAWVVRRVTTPREVQQLTEVLAGSSTAPSAVETDLPGGNGHRPELAALFEGSRSEATARAEAAARVLGGGATVEQAPPDWWGSYPFDADDVALKIWGRPGELFAVIYALRDAAGVPVAIRGSVGAGVAHVALPDTLAPERLDGMLTAARTVLLARGGGGCTVLRAPMELRDLVETHGPGKPSEEAARLKLALDPEDRMSPGRLAES